GDWSSDVCSSDLDECRQHAIGRRAVAELSGIVVAPREEVARRLHRDGMAEAVGEAVRRDRLEAVALERRRRAKQSASDAELAEGVIAPREQRPAALDRDRVGVADRDFAEARADEGRRRSIGPRAVAELAVTVPAPRIEIAARRDPERAESGRDRDELESARDEGRHEAIGVRAVADLAVIVEAPRIEIAVRLDRRRCGPG